MAIDFMPPRAPSVGLSRRAEFRVISIEFGDGYAEDSRDGINSGLETASLEWNSLSESEASEIYELLRATDGVDRIRYALPGDATARLWKCTRVQRSYRRAGRGGVQATFEEVVL